VVGLVALDYGTAGAARFAQFLTDPALFSAKKSQHSLRTNAELKILMA
jgi:hypothetical protein